MKVIMKEERQVSEGDRKYLLTYELMVDKFPKEEGSGSCYDIQIAQYDWLSGDRVFQKSDGCRVTGFSESYGEAKYFFGKLVEGTAMPVSLFAVVDDWKSAFAGHPFGGGLI